MTGSLGVFVAGVPQPVLNRKNVSEPLPFADPCFPLVMMEDVYAYYFKGAKAEDETFVGPTQIAKTNHSG